MHYIYTQICISCHFNKKQTNIPYLHTLQTTQLKRPYFNIALTIQIFFSIPKVLSLFLYKESDATPYFH